MTVDDKNVLAHPTAERRLREDTLSGIAELEGDHDDVGQCPPHDLAAATHDEPEEVKKSCRELKRRKKKKNQHKMT